MREHTVESVSAHEPMCICSHVTLISSRLRMHTCKQVQLQVIKALLTIVTCSSMEVHEASLLLAVRTIYTIDLRYVCM